MPSTNMEPVVVVTWTLYLKESTQPAFGSTTQKTWLWRKASPGEAPVMMVPPQEVVNRVSAEAGDRKAYPPEDEESGSWGADQSSPLMAVCWMLDGGRPWL